MRTVGRISTGLGPLFMSSNKNRGLTPPDLRSREELVAAWTQAFGRPSPPNLSKKMLEASLDHFLQAQKYGTPTRRVKYALSQAMHPGSKGHAKRPREGSQLIREWNGIPHVVEVLQDGFVYRGIHYASLTSIAFKITNAHWSGPRFFGLKARSS